MRARALLAPLGRLLPPARCRPAPPPARARRRTLAALTAVGLALPAGSVLLAGPVPPAAAAADETIAVLRGPGQTVTVVAERQVASLVPVLLERLAPHAARVGRWAGARPPATIFLVADPKALPDLPGPEGELPGAQLDLDRAALHLWAGVVAAARRGTTPELTRDLSTFLVQTALRQLAGPRPEALPIWLVLGLLDDASLSPAAPVDSRALEEAPFLELLHPSFNAPFLELLQVHPTIGTAVARAIVDDLTRRAAPTQLGALVRALRAEEFDDAFARIYGLTLEAYQAELRRELGFRRTL